MNSKETIGKGIDPAQSLKDVLEIAERHRNAHYGDLTNTEIWNLAIYAMLKDSERALLDPEQRLQADNVIAEVNQALYGDPGLPPGGVGGSSRP